MQFDELMRLRPKLLSTVEPEEQVPVGVSQDPLERPASRGGKFWKVFAGALILAAIIFAYGRTLKDPVEAFRRKMVPALTRHLETTPDVVATPEPLVAQVEADMLRVTAISLGHPRIALINGKPVGEGDVIVIHPPNRSIAVTIRVVKIADGRIDVFDGSKTFAVRLAIPETSRR